MTLYAPLQPKVPLSPTAAQITAGIRAADVGIALAGRTAALPVALSDVILAAGGLVWRNSPRGREIALVHRPKYDDWTLPKGKLDPGESWQDGAVREVEEETGFDVRLGAA